MMCVYCQRPFKRNLSLGELFKLEVILPQELCPLCSSLFKSSQNQANCYGCHKVASSPYCRDCRLWQEKQPTVDFHHDSLFQYNRELHDWFQQFKYYGHRNLATTFNRELRAYYNQNRDWLFVPIPLSLKRLKERGFNQVEELLKASQIPYVNCLKKGEGDKQPQTSKSRRERLATPQYFYLAQGAIEQIRDQKILLIDDVYTTGQTLFHGRSCLEEGGPKKVKTFSIGR